MRASSAAVLVVGDELIAGDVVDRNSPAVARVLAEAGWSPERFAAVGDDAEAIADCLRELCRRHVLVVVTGGLGPTLDDVTRDAAARAAGVPLVRSEDAARWIERYFARSPRPMAASNERQAWIPAGAEPLANPGGSAPGFRLEIDASTVFCLPGPPRELGPMLESELAPWLAARPPKGAALARRFYLFGLSEGVLADRAGEWMERGANPLFGVTFTAGVLAVRLLARASTPEEARALLDARAGEFLERFGAHVFSESCPDLAGVLIEELAARGRTLALAESCTGGLASARVARVAGASRVLQEGFVTYSERAKVERLGVERAMLERHGAVSREVALAMALGARRASGADLAVSVTGVAGPGGGSDAKPVGLVWFGVATADGEQAEERRFPAAGRERVQDWAAATALYLALRATRSLP